MTSLASIAAAESWHPKLRKDRTSLQKMRQAERSFQAVVQRHLSAYLRLVLQHFEASGIVSDQGEEEADRLVNQFLANVDQAYDSQAFLKDVAQAYSKPLELGAAMGAKDLPKGVRFAEEDVLTSVDWSLLDEEVVDWVNEHSAGLVTNVTETSRARIRKQLEQGIRLGESRDELAERLKNVLNDIPEWRARMIAQTEVIQAHTQGALDVYRKSGVVEGKRWVDGQPNACPLCSELNQQIVPLDEAFASGHDGPPRHPGCRCTVAPALNVVKPPVVP